MLPAMTMTSWQARAVQREGGVGAVVEVEELGNGKTCLMC